MDALRGGDDPERASTETEPPAARTETEAETTERTLVEARADLRAAGVPAGVLTYADEDCRLHYVTLPDLGPHPGPEGSSCSFDSTVGDEYVFAGQPPDPFGVALSLRCRRGTVQLRMPNGDLYARALGACGIAWRPDGTPTFLHGGEVMQFAPCPGAEPGALPARCSRTLLSRADLRREFRRARWIRFDFRVDELHWLSDRRFAAIVHAGPREGPGADLLAVFESRRLVSRPLFAYDDLGGLRPSPSGALVAARIGSAGGLAVVGRRGQAVRLAMRHGQALTWSPDERWIAEATADGIYIFRADDPSPVFVHVPIVARDLVWR